MDAVDNNEDGDVAGGVVRLVCLVRSLVVRTVVVESVVPPLLPPPPLKVAEERCLTLRPDAVKTKSVLWLDPPLPLQRVETSNSTSNSTSNNTTGSNTTDTIATTTEQQQHSCHYLVAPDTDTNTNTNTESPSVHNLGVHHYECILQSSSSSLVEHDTTGTTSTSCSSVCTLPSKETTATTPTGTTFYIGGFQLVSNAPHVKVHLTPAFFNTTTTASYSSNCVEEYVTTVRGLRYTTPMVPSLSSSPSSACTTQINSTTATKTDSNESQSLLVSSSVSSSPTLYRSQCVIPGGPRPVQSVRLELNIPHGRTTGSTTTSTGTTTASASASSVSSSSSLWLHSIRWTVRLPEAPVPTSHQSSAVVPQSPLLQQQQQQQQIPVGGNAMWANGHGNRSQHQQHRTHQQQQSFASEAAGLTYAVQQSQQRLLHQLQASHEQLHAQLQTSHGAIHTLTTHVAQLTRMVEEQQRRHKQQRDEQQAQFTRQLDQHHEQLVQALQRLTFHCNTGSNTGCIITLTSHDGAPIDEPSGHRRSCANEHNSNVAILVDDGQSVNDLTDHDADGTVPSEPLQRL